MAKKASSKKADSQLAVETITHSDAKRPNIPTAELESVMEHADKSPIRVAFERRNRDLDPQLVWRGKDEKDWSDLVVHAPPLYIQEKVHPKVLVDDLLRQSRTEPEAPKMRQLDLFADFNGVPEHAKSAEFYKHDANWTNRMILGDSLQVMATLAEREGLRGKVQCIYFDPPYGIKFNSNFQWSTTSRDVKDGKTDHITREPEQVKAFRDTWRDGIHSYLTYLRDRLTVARDLLAESGSIFVQIGDENVHRVRTVMDEVFGEDNFVSQISFNKNSGLGAVLLPTANDYILWFGKNKDALKFRDLKEIKTTDEDSIGRYTSALHADGRVIPLTQLPEGDNAWRVCTYSDLTKPGPGSRYEVQVEGEKFTSGQRWWGMPPESMDRAILSGRIKRTGRSISFIRLLEDSPAFGINNIWTNIGGVMSRSDPKIYVVQTSTAAIQRCVLMTTDPGDLVLDPTCGSGTTATVAEQWGRRWITIDTSRVALALARARIMGARYSYYLLSDSRDGQLKEAEVTQTAPSSQPTRGNIRHGFVYERVPHITLKSIANNAEIDVIWDKWQAKLEPLRESLNKALKQNWQEWEIPREAPDEDAKDQWPDTAKKLHGDWWTARIARQKEIDASIAAKAEFEYLYDKPYQDKSKVRVAGPFTVESLSPHRVLTVNEDDDLIDPNSPAAKKSHEEVNFAQMVLDHLLTSGVQQAHKEDRIKFTSVTPWPGHYIAAEGRYTEGDADDAPEKRAGIFIGPEFGTVARGDLVTAAREAGDAGFDVLIACAFNFDAHSSEFDKLGRVPILKARMNADLHMAGELKNTGAGNLFVIFGEPDIAIYEGGSEALKVESQKVAEQVVGLEKEAAETAQTLAGLKQHLKDLKKQQKEAPPTSKTKTETPQDPLTEEINQCEADLADMEKFAAEIDRKLARCAKFIESTTDIPKGHIVLVVYGVDVFKPQTGEVTSDNADGIACWFIDTDYNEESFFVRHAYFLGQNDPYKALKTTLKADINAEVWESLNSDTSRPFQKPLSGRIAVKVINHLGDEVMKVFRVK